MDKSNKKQTNPKNKNKILSLDNFKEKQESKEKRIREFEQGPQPLPTCTCGQHTDPNEFLIEKQVTKHYLKDRKRYVKGLNTEDPLESYMGVFKDLMGDAPLVKLNMKTQSDAMDYISNYFNKGMSFYEQYIKDKEDLTCRAEIEAKDLIIMYEEYKKHIGKSLINSYIIDKLDFIRENNEFAWTKNELIKRDDTLDTHLNETEGYIKFMEEHFYAADISLRQHIISSAAKKLNDGISKTLNANHISSTEVYTLGLQMQESLDEIKETIARNRKRDIKVIKKQYDELKDECSLEYKAEMLIDLELRNRQIQGSEYSKKTEFTANNSTKQLIETIGMENLIKKLSTQELEKLFHQFNELE